MMTTMEFALRTGGKHVDDRQKTDKEFWTAWLALADTLKRLNEAVEAVVECQGKSMLNSDGVGSGKG